MKNRKKQYREIEIISTFGSAQYIHIKYNKRKTTVYYVDAEDIFVYGYKRESHKYNIAGGSDIVKLIYILHKYLLLTEKEVDNTLVELE